MKRPKAHVIEEQSESIFKSFLPKEWIVRKIPKDYGVDYEVEIVEGEDVTGSRFWFQLKGTESVEIRKHRFDVPPDFRHISAGKGHLDWCYFAFAVDTKLLEYSLKCDFPLLLGVVLIPEKEAYWIPLRDVIERKLERDNSNWRKQKTATVLVPMNNSFSEETKTNYKGLRWYALEPARMRAFSILHVYHHQLQYDSRLTGYTWGEGSVDPSEEVELIRSLNAARIYLKMALELDCLFGDRGVDIYISLTKPQMEDGLKACQQLLQEMPTGNLSFESFGVLMGKVWHAVNLMSTCISMYQDLRERFLFNTTPFFHVRER